MKLTIESDELDSPVVVEYDRIEMHQERGIKVTRSLDLDLITDLSYNGLDRMVLLLWNGEGAFEDFETDDKDSPLKSERKDGKLILSFQSMPQKGRKVLNCPFCGNYPNGIRVAAGHGQTEAALECCGISVAERNGELASRWNTVVKGLSYGMEKCSQDERNEL